MVPGVVRTFQELKVFKKSYFSRTKSFKFAKLQNSNHTQSLPPFTHPPTQEQENCHCERFTASWVLSLFRHVERCMHVHHRVAAGSFSKVVSSRHKRASKTIIIFPEIACSSSSLCGGVCVHVHHKCSTTVSFVET